MEDLTVDVDEVEQDPPEAEPERPRGPTKSPFTDALEAGGVLDALADAIVTLYTEPKQLPELFNFYVSTIGTAEQDDVEKILLENQELRKKKADLQKRIAELETRGRK